MDVAEIKHDSFVSQNCRSYFKHGRLK